MKPITTMLTFVTLLFSLMITPVWAISLEDAKQQGAVGEQLNGYLGIVKHSSDVSALVNNINAKRRAAYAKSARDADVDINIIELRIGERLIKRAPAGQYIQTPNGQWSKK
ncbi:YdbL family protein [Amphritea sp. 1_MG-2023]|uniref:YdbL family protein n=1 Tax=Amphritea sp. 1_MG-2023 TaxID=3062670 RepID=UPI0026E1E47B|nr:YdbL family protein [Amphritea sp. 1_MG-2023]MDO6564354.1 YdbL family protein [Amphritea sp. 1_MG-2023]